MVDEVDQGVEVGRCPSGRSAALRAEPAAQSQAKPAVSNASSEQEREWTLWSDQRTPNAEGTYRFRATFPFLGVTVTVEWEEEQRLCGMGYGDSEWWPLRPCYWDGYRRYITNNTLEWSPVHAYDSPGIVWHGLDLLPCPFTGQPPKVEAQGRYIGAPLWHSEAVWISSPMVRQQRWTDAKAMQAAWNTRAHASVDTLPQGGDGEAGSVRSKGSAVGEAETPEARP
jgi:hypothetical protein